MFTCSSMNSLVNRGFCSSTLLTSATFVITFSALSYFPTEISHLADSGSQLQSWWYVEKKGKFEEIEIWCEFNFQQFCCKIQAEERVCNFRTCSVQLCFFLLCHFRFFLLVFPMLQVIMISFYQQYIRRIVHQN